MSFSILRVGTVLAASAVLLIGSNSADAGWGFLRGGSSGGSSGGYASYYGSSGYSGSSGSSGYSYSVSYGGSGYYSSSGSYGSSGYYSSSGGSSGGWGSRVRAHWAAKRARFAARRASWGSSGYYASSGGSSGYTTYSTSYSYGSGSYGSSGSYSYGGSSGYAARPVYYSSGYGSSGTVYSSGYGSSGTVYSSGYGSSGTIYSSGYGSSGAVYSSGYSSSGGSSGTIYSSGYGHSGAVYGGVSYGSSGVSYGSSGTVYYGASTSSPASASSVVSNVSGDAVYLTVAVPSDANIYVNGNKTKSIGAVREFVSRGLLPGKSYEFEVRAEIVGSNGQMLVEKRKVSVTAGQREQMKFAFTGQQTPIETAVTLNVPEGAKVVLAGNETKAKGGARVYKTNSLKPGQIWDDYEIEVHHQGQVKTRSVRLVAGDKLKLTFAFDDENTIGKIAAR